MNAVRAAGWGADCEVFSAPGEPRWVADVIATHGSVRIAFEAQLANVPWGELTARQDRYREAGIRGLWLLGQEHYPVSKEVPAFQVRLEGDGAWSVRVSPPDDHHNVTLGPFPGNWATLETFIGAALTKNLVWSPIDALNRVDVRIRATPYGRCPCGTRLLLPTSLAVALAHPGYRSLLWTIKPRTSLASKSNPGPAWLNALVRIINRGYPERSGALLATRHTQGRALDYYLCPVCAAETDEIAATRKDEISIYRGDLAVRGLLPEAGRKRRSQLS